MSEPHWRKRRREAMERKQTPNFYAGSAVSRLFVGVYELLGAEDCSAGLER